MLLHTLSTLSAVSVPVNFHRISYHNLGISVYDPKGLFSVFSPRILSTASSASAWNDITIPGSSNPDHIAENYDIFDFELTSQEMTEIRGIDRQARYENW